MQHTVTLLLTLLYNVGYLVYQVENNLIYIKIKLIKTYEGTCYYLCISILLKVIKI